MNKISFSPQIIQNNDTGVKAKTPNGISVKIHIPDRPHDRVRQQKINKIYEILSADTIR